MPRRPISPRSGGCRPSPTTAARALLGAAGDHLLDPTGLKDLVEDENHATTTTTTEPPPDEPDEPDEPEDSTP